MDIVIYAEKIVRKVIKLYIDPDDPFKAEDSEGNEYELSVDWPEDGGDPVVTWIASYEKEDLLCM